MVVMVYYSDFEKRFKRNSKPGINIYCQHPVYDYWCLDVCEVMVQLLLIINTAH